VIKGGATSTVLSISSGSIQGALDVRDDTLRPLRADLDALARQMVVSVNAAYNPGAARSDFFDPAGLTAASIAVATSVSAATLRAGTGAAGDNSVAQAVAGLATRSFSVAGGDVIDGTFSEHYARAVSNLGQQVSAANSNASDQTSIEQYVRAQRDGVSGVSMDEEMADLVKFQRAFQASSRVFSIVDSLLDSVVNQLGR
jgi:flagellar hook-associated protein 1 FlgK